MNRWCLAGKACSFYVEFKKDGEFVQPDPSSIKLTIRNNSGTPVSGYNEELQPDTLMTSLLFTIPEGVNAITGTVENRFIRLDYTSNGVPCVFIDSYRLCNFVPFTATPNDVRNILGARGLEIKDEEADLYEAYFQLLRTNSTISAALIAGTDVSMYANRAIALKAALTLVPSMPSRALKEDTMHNASAIRATVDWVKMEQAIKDELGNALLNMESATNPGIQFSNIFIVSNPTDPVTNA